MYGELGIDIHSYRQQTSPLLENNYKLCKEIWSKVKKS